MLLAHGFGGSQSDLVAEGVTGDGGAVLLVIVSNVLGALIALGAWRTVLPTHYSYA